FKTLHLTVARAGHPYPLVFRANGPIELLRPQGAMLGVFQDERFELTSLQLHDGDRVLFYTDGFEMVFPKPDPGNERGTDAPYSYVEIFKDLGAGTIAGAMQGLTSRLNRQVGSLNQSDDLTALLVGMPTNAIPGESKSIPQVASAVR
ncbi:MAG: SpoIIE family protein phosphatase, partial [Pirellulaceae bacterium]|nr:SpoIIE family protein phosphatase [Pirellulaceae bacterium]